MTKRIGLKKIGFKSIHLEMNSTDEQCAAAAQACRDAGLDLYACGVCYMNSEDEVTNTFRYAKAAGMRQIIGVPKHELLPFVEAKVKEFDIEVAIHNHGPGDKLYPTPESVMEKIERLDKRIGICNDLGHTFRSGIDPAKSIIECRDRMLGFHVKDETSPDAKGQAVICGHGKVDLVAVFEALKEIGYNRVVDFEYEAEAKDPFPGLAESVGYVRGIIKTLARG